MNKRLKLFLLLVLLLGLFVGLAGRHMPASLAEGNYVLLSGSNAPGGVLSGGAYTLKLAVGQTEAGLQKGGAYEVGGGLLGGGPVTQIKAVIKAFLPLLLRPAN